MRGGKTRSVLFLQGPASPFMARVGHEIAKRGHRVLRINLSLGDQLFWRRPGAVAYRGRLKLWGGFIADFLDSEEVTDLALLGDCRPHQIATISAAQARGIRVHAIEHGYFRPDWLTVERDGMSSFSHMPRNPDTIRALAAGKPEPSFEPIAPVSFRTYALWDLTYNLANVFIGPVTYPYYRSHSFVHPLVEYGGWLRKFALQRAEDRHRAQVLAALAASKRPTFLMPLQLATDFQLRVHSPFPHLYDAVRWVIRSFAAHADTDARLVFKVHPLDNMWANWRKRIAGYAVASGVADRVFVIDGGDLEAMIAASAGVVTVNSTVGIAVLRALKPLIALGNAVFDVPGITDQQPLSGFWTRPDPPDAALVADFIKLLAWATQVRGGFTAERAIALGACNVAVRILEDGERLPRITPQDRSAVTFRRRAEWLAER